MTDNFFNIQPGAEIKVLTPEGDWKTVPKAQTFEYPTTARRAFVNLAEAVRTVNDGKGVRNMLTAIAGLHMSEPSRYTVLSTFLANVPPFGEGEFHRENIASSLARLLHGQEKFHAGRFVHHATSDSVEDADSDEGKWSFNRLHQAEAQKTTIESVPDDGDGETVVVG
jgi:hypothetical protein